MKPKVLVGCPVADYAMYSLKKYLEGVKALTYPNFDFFLVDNSKDDKLFEEIKSLGIDVAKTPYSEPARKRIVESRNVIVEKMLKEGYDYFLSLEFDVIPPKDVVEMLLTHGKEIVSGVYFKEFRTLNQNGKLLKKEIMPLAYKSFGKSRVRRMRYNEVKGNDLIDVRIVGLGCILIHREIFEKGIRFRYDSKKEGVFDDTNFCLDVAKEGYKIYMDNSVKCLHLVKEKNWDKIKK